MTPKRSPITEFRLLLLERFAGQTVEFQAILDALKLQFPELCDDSVLCKHETPYRPEWQHQARQALDYLKNKQRLIQQKRTGEYTFPVH